MSFDMLVFDIDGVLVDVKRSYREAIKQTVQKMRKNKVSDCEIEAIKKIPGFNNDWNVSYALIYRISNPKKINSTSKEYANVKTIFQQIYNSKKLYEKEHLLVKEKTLERLAKKTRLGIITSRPRAEALYALRRFIPKFFNEYFIIALEDCKKEKPDSGPLLILKKRANSARMLYVGDTINDAIATQKAGVVFVSVAPKIPADIYIKNVNEVPNLLELRIAKLARKTTETKILGKLNLDGSGKAEIKTGIEFFDHMLSTIAKQGMFDIALSVNGDLRVDQHHIVEDTGIVLGKLFKEALGEKKGIHRYGFFILPMDEALALAAIDITGKGLLSKNNALALAAIDLSGRGKLVFDAIFGKEKTGEFVNALTQEFFEAFVRECGCTLNLKLLEGKNEHHKIEALFKVFARALRMACEMDEKQKEIPSTKGMI